MTDKELLHAAAKAAGISEPWSFDKLAAFQYGAQYWNPLEDDGDALRLAVKLRMNISFTRGLGPGYTEEFMQVVPATLGHLAEFGPIGSDVPATVRRAIVRAAAAMAS